MPRWSLALVLLLLLASVLPSPAVAEPASPHASLAGDWPQYRGNAARTGATAAPGPGPGAVVIWRRTIDGSTAPVAVTGTLYVGDDLGKMHLIDLATVADHELDVDPYGDATAFTGVAVAEGAVFDLLRDGTLRVVDLATGTERWDTIDLATDVAPLIEGASVYLADTAGGIVALDTATGAQRWRSQLASEGGLRSSMALDAGRLVVGETNGTFEAFDASTGVRLWTYSPSQAIPGGLLEPPTIADGMVIGIDYKLLASSLIFAIDAATGAERWIVSSKEEPDSAVAVAGGLVFVGTFAGSVLALDAATGGVRWQVATGNEVDVFTPPVVAAGTVYAVDRAGLLVAMDGATGTERWRLPLGEQVDGSPAVAGGVLYLTSHNNSLFAIADAAGSGTPAATPA